MEKSNKVFLFVIIFFFNILSLNAEEKIYEIARMLSGKNVTDEAIKAATKLIESSQ